ncbi:MAG TPA: EpsI family protein [Chthoniobacterales bacterium]|nr:EpsI family protein [Chthoniobacterales bacterium]
MKKRLLILETVLLCGLSVIFLLPHARLSSPSGIAMKLPTWIGTWLGEDAEITAKEVGALAKDTQFARKTYTSPDGDQIFVSIVLSGGDMASSIHRPERCLPAQGWNLRNSTREAIPIDNGRSLGTTLLKSVRLFVDERGNERLITNLNYYWFIGYNRLTPSHLQRTLWDMRDRLLYGYDQRWAYVTVTGNVTEGLVRPNRSEADTRKVIEKFTAELVHKLETPTGAPLM